MYLFFLTATVHSVVVFTVRANAQIEMFASGCSLLERGIYMCICFSCRLPYTL